jgi:hypothetical protein
MNEPTNNIFVKSKVIRRRVSGNQTRDDNPRMKRVLKRRLKGETQEDHLDLNNTTIGRDGRCKLQHYLSSIQIYRCICWIFEPGINDLLIELR